MRAEDKSGTMRRGNAGFGCASRILAAAACVAMGVSTSQAAETQAAEAVRVQSDQVREIGGELYTFYAGRGYRPLWWSDRGELTPAANAMLKLLETSEYDGIPPASFKMSAVEAAIRDASAKGSADKVSRAELLLSQAFVAYVQALRSNLGSALIYEHGNLRPQTIGAYNLLSEASATSLDAYVGEMKWMHPLYAPLRVGLVTNPTMDEAKRKIVMGSLARLRGIPNARRHILVDVASARLWMYESGKAVDTMRVVVGKAATRTPLLAGYVRYAITNPYWNVPEDMVSATIARNVLSRGPGYLKGSGYQVLSDWSDSPNVVDPRTIDWRAAQRGELDLRVRQLPTAGNFMGKVKYEFPNPYGIYLHDTPQKDLMQKDARQLSNGCIRLEDAQRLGRWLMQGELPDAGGRPEHKVDLPRPVPIYITYLSARADNGDIALGPDPYGLDSGPALATGASRSEISRR